MAEKPCMNLVVLIIVSLFCSTFAGHRGDRSPVAFGDCIQQYVKASETLSSKTRIRIAVMDFTPTDHRSAVLFGSYFSEHLISALGSNTRFRIFERKRLDAVTGELALNQTGLIDGKTAKKIGELVPIDYLLTGTFTRFDHVVEVNGRILDVVTGEIKTAISRKIKLTDDLAALFPQPTSDKPRKKVAGTLTGAKNSNPCDDLISRLKPLVKSSSYREIIDIMVTISFSHPCSNLHWEIVGILEKNRFADKKYRTFFIREITAAGDPDAVRGPVGDGLRYFGIDGAIDKEEWNCFTTMLRRSRRCGEYICMLFNGRLYDTPPDRWYNVMDDYITSPAVTCGASGSSERAAAFSWMLPRDIDDEGDMRLMHYWYDHHAAKLRGKDIDEVLHTAEEYYLPDFIIKIDSSFFKEGLDRFIFFTRRCTPGEKNARITMTLINKLERATDILFPDEWRPFFSRELARFGDSCSEVITRQLKAFPDNDRLKYVFPFCLRHDIHIDGRIPTIEELTERLTDKSIRVRIEAAELLASCGDKTLPVVPRLCRALERSIADGLETGDPNLQEALIEAIANSGTRDRAVFSLIISMLEQPSHTGLPKKTKEIISSIGPPIFPVLQKEYPAKKNAVRIMLVESIKMMGNRGAQAAGWLKKIRATANDDEKDAIDDALEAVGG
ncbi:MAG: hypothetical protein JW863_21085 [Chitinispirillaceae bacterium]|nr:hypothetical protein [Chitinispirillaceae bacterium]